MKNVHSRPFSPSGTRILMQEDFFAVFPSQPSPYGMTYFKRPTARPTDGRLYIDFLGEFKLFSNKIMLKRLAKNGEFV